MEIIIYIDGGGREALHQYNAVSAPRIGELIVGLPAGMTFIYKVVSVSHHFYPKRVPPNVYIHVMVELVR